MDLSRVIAVDTETTSLDTNKAVLTHISWCTSDGKAVASAHGTKASVVGPIRDKRYLKVFHNAKYDIRVLNNNGIPVRGPFADTLVMAQMTIIGKRFGLKHLTARLLQEPYDEEDKLKAWVKKNKRHMSEAPASIILPYARKDALCTMKLFLFLMPLMDKRDLWPVFWKEMKLMRNVVMPMEDAGMLLDVDECIVLKHKLEERRTSLVSGMRRLTGDEDFNPNAYRQLAKYIFGWKLKPEDNNGLKIVAPRRFTPSKIPKTDVLCLKLAGTPLAKMALHYRKANNCISKYLNKFLQVRDSNDVVHPTINQTGAKTGRFSITNPSFQNIPISGTKDEDKVRKVFTPRYPCDFVFIDFAQIELRLAAHFSGQEYLIDAIKAGQDLHAVAATQFFGVKPRDKGWKKYRYLGKRMNFELLYGCGPYKFRDRLFIDSGMKISFQQSCDYINAYRQTNDRIMDLFDTVRNEVYSTGGVRTAYGRYIEVPPQEEYKGVNYKIQGTAADVIKEKMPKCKRILKGTKSQMLLQIHDELVFEIHPSERQLVYKLVKAMQELDKFVVPLTCTASQGKNWLDKRPIKL